ncbi:MAG: PAS domain S-box protein [Nitrospirae bacterium]|nr:PAS domain S-box protein [Nitrospirota bacterium]
MIRNLKIGSRIVLGYLLILFIFMLLSLFSIGKLNHSTDQMRNLYERPFMVKSKLLSINANTYKIRLLLRKAYSQDTKDETVKTKLQVSSVESEIMYDLTVVENLYSGDKNLIRKHIRSHYEEYISLNDDYFNLLLQGKRAEALKLLDSKIDRNAAENEKLLQEAVNAASNDAFSLYESVLESNYRYRHILFAILVMAILLSAVLSFVFTRMITLPISRLLKAAKEIGSGNFDVTIEVSAKDEVGQLSQAFQEMTENLRHNISGSEQLMDALRQELALQSSITKVTEALLDLKNDKYDISRIVHDESLILTESAHGYVSIIDENGDNAAYTLTGMMVNECKVAMAQQAVRFPKGPDGYNSMWGHSLNTGEDFFTNSPKEHKYYKASAPPGHVEIKNFLSVCVKSGGMIIGQIALANSTRDYTDRDLSVIRQLASIYAVALERKEVDERLKESEHRFRIIFEKAPIGVAITEAATCEFVQVNQEYSNITGYSSDELLSSRFQDITHPGDIQQHMDGLKLLHRGDIPVFSMEKRYIHKNSKIVWVSLTAIPLYVGSNQPELNLTIVEDITDKKRMAEVLKESERDVIEAQSKAKFGTWTYDPVTRQPKWSLEMYNIWGVDPKLGPLSYSDLSNYIHPDDWQRFDDTVRESIELHKSYELEIRLCMSDETEKILCVIGEPILDASGKLLKLRGSNQDITRRKNLETKLEEARTQLQSIINCTTAVVFLKDLQGRYILINSQYETLFHVTKEGVVGMTDYDIFPREQADNFRAHDIEVEKKKAPLNFDELVQHDDGVHTYISVKFPMFDMQGQIYGVCGIATDITERKRMEEELLIEVAARRTAEKRLALLLEASFEGISITENGRIIDANKRLAEMFGCDEGEVLGISVFDTVTPQYREIIRKHVSEGYDKPYELDCLKKDGTIISVEVCGRNMEYEGHRIRLVAIRDITQRKRMELQLKRLNDHLMELVTEEIQKRQRNEQLLIQQSKMASMGEMIGLIAHQWRQPLNAVGMIVQDIKQAYIYGELDELYINNSVDTTMKQVYFMSKTIEDFKNFFKPSKERVRFNITVAIEELLAMFSHIFKKSDVDISFETWQDAIMFTEGYPNEFKQVVLNIMNNAKDAITSKRDAGNIITGLIEINLSNNEQLDKVIVSMRDNGGGIPEQIIEKIFDPYYTTKGDQGTGIGLYMSKTIIETNMGGTLTVKNVDEGAEFMITLGISESETV